MSLLSILLFFLITALLGLTLIYFVFRNKKRPMLIAAAHGIFALSSFSLLLYYSAINYEISGGRKVPYWSLVLFTIAIAGGLYIFIKDKVIKTGIKKWMPMVHGSAAILGILILIIYIIR